MSHEGNSKSIYTVLIDSFICYIRVWIVQERDSKFYDSKRATLNCVLKFRINNFDICGQFLIKSVRNRLRSCFETTFFWITVLFVSNMNSIFSYFVTLLVLQSVISENVRDNGNNTANEIHEENEGSRALSRRKRFVIFPDGSSLQLGRWILMCAKHLIRNEIIFFCFPFKVQQLELFVLFTFQVHWG